MAPQSNNTPNQRQEAFRQQAAENCHYTRLVLNSKNLWQHADDATHIAWLKVYTMLGDPDCNIANPRNYMVTTAYNLALAMQRNGARGEPLAASNEPFVDDRAYLGCKELKPVTDDAVFEAVCSLPKEMSEVFIASVWDGLPQEALAEKFSITRYRLKQIVALAIQAIRAWLRDRGYDLPLGEECA